MERRDIHDYDARAERAFQAIMNSDMSEKNKTSVSKFRNFCFAQGLTKGRIAKHLWGLLVIGRILKKDFDIVIREDVENLVAQLRAMEYSNSSLVDFNITIKKFYNWMKQYPPKQYPPEVAWLSTAKKDEDLRDPSEDLTIDEIKALANAAEHPRDKAFVWVLYETAGRVGEVLQVRLKDVNFGKIATIRIWGEKVRKWREAPLVQARADLATWFDVHPLRNNPDSYLWISIGTKNHNKPLAYGSVVRLLQILAAKAGIKKPINPHSFRHSRLSFLGDYLTDSQLGEFAGWKPGSKMAKVYVRPKMTKAAILGIYGMKTEEEQKEVLEPKICKVCDMLNSPESKYCRRCGNTIDIDAAMQELAARQTRTRIRD